MESPKIQNLPFNKNFGIDKDIYYIYGHIQLNTIMKKSQLRQIIKEEISKVLNEKQLEFQFETFEDLQEKANEIDGYADLSGGGFSLPIQNIMLDIIGTYEIRKIDDESVNVVRFDKKGNKKGEKDNPLEVIKDYIDNYKTW